MQGINEILNWNFNPTNLKNSGEKILSESTKSKLRDSIETLKDISERLPVGNKKPEVRLLRDIFWRFKKNKKEEPEYLLSLFSQRDVRALVWTLDYIEDNEETILFSDDFKIALAIINRKWKDSFIISLWHLLLKNWVSLNEKKKQLDLLLKVMKDKSDIYNGSRKDVYNVASNISLFLDKNSPDKYASELFRKKISINLANQLVNQKENVLLYEYYSIVIQRYLDIIEDKYKNIQQEKVIELYDFLEKHNSKKTTLIICSELINNNKFYSHMNIIKDQTIIKIGDPIKTHLWKFNGLTSNQENNIEAARKRLNIILNKQFIKTFFEKLVQDERRKNYWLKFVDKIEDIIFCGNKGNYIYLKNIEKVSKHVDSRYRVTSSNQGTSALIIYSKNYVFVEFTDVGALYIYKDSSFNVNLNRIRSITELKVWATSHYACKNSIDYGYVDLNSEGRITHQGDWESRTDIWMKKYYGK